MTLTLTTDRTDTIEVPAAWLRTLLGLLEESADLRARELADAYARGRTDALHDPGLIERITSTARELAEARLALMLQSDPELPDVAQLVAERRARIDEWVRTGRNYPAPGRAA